MRRHGAALNVLVTMAEEEKVKWWRRGVRGISRFWADCVLWWIKTDKGRKIKNRQIALDDYGDV
jgi:hypothetical protein